MSEIHNEMGRRFVKEDRMANQDETNAIVTAMKSFGMNDAEKYAYHLYGRMDEPYGFYVFGITPIAELYGDEKFRDGQTEKYIILGDCLDVLPDYDRVLTLQEVHEFAICEMDGRYEAIQKWGVFHSLSAGLKNALFDNSEHLDEMMYWGESRNNWVLRFDMPYTTDSGANEMVVLTIPANLSSQEEADKAFAKAWKDYVNCFDFDEELMRTVEEVGDGKKASTWVEAKEEKLRGILSVINEYMGYKGEDTSDDVEAKHNEKDNHNKVWVLTITKDGQNFPEVHRTFEGAVEGAIADIMEHMDEEEVDEYDYAAIRKALEDEHYWEDENTDAVYDICDCPLCK